MKNTYETAAIVELGQANRLILGMKFIDPFGYDWILGAGFYMWMEDDIDEGDE